MASKYIENLTMNKLIKLFSALSRFLILSLTNKGHFHSLARLFISNPAINDINLSLYVYIHTHQETLENKGRSPI